MKFSQIKLKTNFLKNFQYDLRFLPSSFLSGLGNVHLKTCEIRGFSQDLILKSYFGKRSIRIISAKRNFFESQFIWFSVSYSKKKYSKIFQNFLTCKIFARFLQDLESGLENFSNDFSFVTCLINNNLLQSCFLKH